VPVDAYRRYFEDNPELFAGLVAALALVFGLIGNVLGAKIQANGGRDQAAAAREAAKITAEAQRVAALWTVRQVQVAEFIRCANGIYQKCCRLWSFPPEEDIDAAMSQLGLQSEELSLRWAEIRLILTEEAVAAAGQLVLATSDFEVAVHRYGHLRQARAMVTRVTWDDESLTAEVHRIIEFDQGDETRRRALRDAVPGLTDEHARYLLLDRETSNERIDSVESRLREAFLEALNKLVHEVRAMLRSENDQAPTQV
jgi:hypothetical protein